MDVPLIEIRGLNKRYRSGDGSALILDDIHLKLPVASLTVVRGMSGSGKTTLLNILGGLDTADSGEVRVADQHLQDLDSAGLGRFRARDVGFIFQFHNLIPTLTVKENLLTGLEPLRRLTPEDHALALRYLDKVGLAAYADRFPARLSGGQQQRVAIARALIKEPALILADEPTGSLDEQTGLQVFELLRQLREDKQVTVVIVTHNPSLGDYADLIYDMRDGRLHPVAR